MNIGEPVRRFVVEPLEEPAPSREPVPEPVITPEPEPAEPVLVP
jgi:hypothetical protein